MSFPPIRLAPRSIAFVDGQLPQLGRLLTGLPRGTELVVLDSRSGGLEQMADVLAERQGIESIHLICHGDPGVLYCGDRPIDILTLPTMRDALHVIANAMVEDGEWLLYGCELAQGVHGRRLVDELAQATGLKVAAASHKVGAAAKGGHWELDYAPQAVDHALQIPQWPNLLTGTTPIVGYNSAGEVGNYNAFAAVLADGSVVTWGYPDGGGDSSAVADALDGTIPVTQVFSNIYAFAALRADGSVVTWGRPKDGGDSSAVAGALNGSIDVTQVFSNDTAFAALRADGSVVTWGNPDDGGVSSAVASALDGTIDVAQVFSNDTAFAALRADGSVVTWGNPDKGGDSSAVAGALDGTIDVVRLFGNRDTFAAVLADGSVVTWGERGGDSSTVAGALDGTIPVMQIFSNNHAFAALRADGSVVTWGDPDNGGDSSAVASALDGTIPVIQLNSNSGAFSALRADGSVVTWGHPDYGGDGSAVAGVLDGTVPATQLFSNSYAFAALRADGSVVTWGDPYSGGNSGGAVHRALDGTIDVTQVFYNLNAFAALRADGSVVTWGSYFHGGNSFAVYPALDGTIDVTQVFSTGLAFAALRADGSVVTWGSKFHGADSSAVASALKNVRDIANVFTDEDLDFIWGDGVLYGSTGDDYFVGGKGIDTAVFNGDQASHTRVKTATGWTVSSAADGTDTLTKIERLQFADKTIALDIDGNAGQVYRMYQAAFNRVPDKGGLGDWIYGMDHGMSLLDVSAGFVNSTEFKSVYGATPTNSEMVTRFYQNVLHRTPEQAGFDYWMNQLESGLQTRTQVLTGFSESPENQLQVIGVIQDGIEYTQHAV